MGVLQSGKKMASSVSNKPRFNFIEDTFLNANGVSTKLWTLPESDLHSALNEEYNDVSTLSHGIVYREFGCGVNPRAHVHSISRPQHLQNRKKISFGLNLRSSCKLNYLRRRQRLAHGKKLAAPSIPNKPLFNFIEDTFLNACGVSTKFLTLPAADLHSALNEEYKDGSPPSPRILNEKICIGTKSFNSAIGDVGAVPSKEHTSSLASCIEEITKQVEFLKQELAKSYSSRYCLKWADLLFSWISKTGALPHYSQESGECWSVALSRGHAYYMAANNIEGKKVTREELLDGVSPKHLMSSGGIDRLENAKDFMVANNYVKDMILHRRPSHPDEFGGFELLLEKLLARGPVVVVFDILPGYKVYDGKSIYTPDETECRVAVFERYNQHSAVVTGCGVGLVDGKPIEFWQTHDSQVPDWGVNGFGQLARRNGLIVAAVEFKF